MPAPIVPVLIGIGVVAAVMASRANKDAGLPPPSPPPGPNPGGGPGGGPGGPGIPQLPFGPGDSSSGQNAGRPVPSAFVYLTASDGRDQTGNGINSPTNIAYIGSNGDAAQAFTTLAAYNPQFNVGHGPNMMGSQIGQAINVPWSWVTRLQQSGFKVYQDPGAQPGTLPQGVPANVVQGSGWNIFDISGNASTGCAPGKDCCDSCRNAGAAQDAWQLLCCLCGPQPMPPVPVPGPILPPPPAPVPQPLPHGRGPLPPIPIPQPQPAPGPILPPPGPIVPGYNPGPYEYGPPMPPVPIVRAGVSGWPATHDIVGREQHGQYMITGRWR